MDVKMKVTVTQLRQLINEALVGTSTSAISRTVSRDPQVESAARALAVLVEDKLLAVAPVENYDDIQRSLSRDYV